MLASRSAKPRTPLPSNLRTEHSLVDLPPLMKNEAAVEVRFSLFFNLSDLKDKSCICRRQIVDFVTAHLHNVTNSVTAF